MAQFAMTVRTEMSPEDAFDFMADLENFATWDPGVTSSVQVSGDGPGLDASYDVAASGTELTYVVTEFERPTRIVAVAQTKLLRSYDVITVETRQGSSYITYDATLELNGPLAMGDIALAQLFKKIGESAAEGLVETIDGVRIQ